MLTNFFDRITRLALRFRGLSIILALAVLAAGVWAMTGLNLELLPRIEFPQTIVLAQWSDAADAETFLAQVTQPLEEKLAAVSGVVNVESTTSKALGIVIVRNEFGLNQDRVLADINDAVDAITYPEGMSRPDVLNFSLSDLPVVVASISSSDLTLPELKALVQEDLVPQMEGLSQVSRVTLSGGQELPDASVAAAPAATEAAPQPTPTAEPTAAPTATPDPARLPDILIQGAQAMGLELSVAQDLTPDFVRQLAAFGPQASQALALLTPDNLRLMPAESLALLPADFLDTLDPALRAELDAIAADYGGAGQLALDEAAAAAEPATEAPQVEPVALPESWIAAAAAAGQTISTTADIDVPVMQGIVSLAPPLLADLQPDQWRALDPAAVAVALPQVAVDLDPLLLQQLTAIANAAAGENPAPVELPAELAQAAAGAGFPITNTAQIDVAAVQLLANFAPQLLQTLTPEVLLGLSPEVQAALPASYVTTLDPDMQQTLAVIAIRAAQFQAAPPIVVAAAQVEPVPLPESWITTAAAAGQTISTTADLDVVTMQTVVSFAPRLLADLQPAQWRAIDPAALAVALPVVTDMDAVLRQQLAAILAASAGENPPAVPLPTAWIAAAEYAGITVTNTAQIPPQAIGLIAGSTPELLDTLTSDVILGLPAEALAVLPTDFLATLDPDTQDTLRVIAIRAAQFQASQVVAETETPPSPTPELTPTVEPGRLPDLLIQGAQAAGVQLEYAQDITPDFMRLFAGLGPQAVQALSLLTPDNLRLLQPEVIALLPPAYLDTLDPALRAELDTLAADYGGAGQLAAAEQAEREAASAGAPPLGGIWIEPAPDGSPSAFQTAADILNNAFVPGAANFLNFFPESPQVQNAADWLGALTPDVIAYLAENEEDFAATLQPNVLEMMSPESLTYLLDNYPDAFAPDLAQRLRGIAAGQIAAFIPEASITRTDGNPAVILSLYKDGDANTVVVAHRIFDALDAYKAEHPGVQTSLVFEQATFIEDSISGVSREGILGGVFAIVVILLFLSGHVGGRYRLSWRATLVTAVSIPLSLFAALLLMRVVPPTIGVWLQGLVETTNNPILTFISRLFPTSVTLNIMTLSGLTVAIGRVVDDSIVVLENSYRFIQRGDDPRHAVLEGTKEVAIAIFSATATTVAVFLPLGLIGGLIGSFFLPFGLTVTYALAASFVVSITVVPALTYLLIRRENIPEERESAMQRWYTPILAWSLRNRWLTMLIAALIFLGSLGLLNQLPRSFIPSIGEPTVNVTVGLPAGTRMAETDSLAREFEAVVADLPAIDTVQTEVGSAGGFEAAFGGGGVRENSAAITISVADQEQINELTNEIRQRAQALFGADNVTVSAASQTGFGGFALVLTGDSAAELQDLVGPVEAALGSVDLDADGVPDIANVSSNVDATAVGGSGTIIRIDGRPAVSFSGDLETDNTIGVTNAAKQAIIDVGLPSGVQVSEGFDSQQQIEGFQSMVVAIGYSIVLVYLIMALTFRSLVHPFTILFSLPFALVGAAIALFITNSVLGISAMIGFMMLVGIVVTNGIVLMELVQQLRQRGKNATDALIEGGRTRLRPIWMTALAAILALIPLAASSEAGAIIASELARAVTGGLLVSTALTLLVVPVVYSLFDGLTNRLRRK
ncbi:MAG: efflux RND transporter permease subunit [Anaerolineales bacterium]|nr:efflux RND transporter permease subunit [Anaerolineales bacterium]